MKMDITVWLIELNELVLDPAIKVDVTVQAVPPVTAAVPQSVIGAMVLSEP